ncbi:O-antigen polymerase [Paraferrimonas sedimenticola]|uniref:O-antigen polymerase n=2 Tax=Paraferrimonas sedimenticola TaxID=375674 RepID=A0AA37RUV6_9GAMM|nr:O-antigen polymerase [Paraferrimonas sedimenticola]
MATLIGIQVLKLLSPDFEAISYTEFGIDVMVEETSTGDTGKYLFWISMFAAALMMTIRRPMSFAKNLSEQLPLVWLVGIGVVSFIWALAPFISFKRSVMQLILVFTLFATVTYLRDPRQIFLIFYRLSIVLLLLNLLSIPIGVGFDVNGNFRGAMSHKNLFGQNAVLALYFGLAVLWFYKSRVNRMVWMGYMTLWLVLLLLSMSKTSIALLLLVPMLLIVANFVAHLFRMNLGVVIASFVAACFMFVAIGTAWFGVSIKPFLQMFVDDVSLTGRDFIWAFVLEEVSQRWFSGHGLGSFWGIGFNSPNVKYGEGFVVHIHQSHNGYIDLLAQLGVVGMALYLAMLAQMSAHLGKIESNAPRLFFICWLIVLFSLTNNITESSIFRGIHGVWVIQLIMIAIASRVYLDSKRRVDVHIN